MKRYNYLAIIGIATVMLLGSCSSDDEPEKPEAKEKNEYGLTWNPNEEFIAITPMRVKYSVGDLGSNGKQIAYRMKMSWPALMGYTWEIYLGQIVTMDENAVEVWYERVDGEPLEIRKIESFRDVIPYKPQTSWDITQYGETDSNVKIPAYGETVETEFYKLGWKNRSSFYVKVNPITDMNSKWKSQWVSVHTDCIDIIKVLNPKNMKEEFEIPEEMQKYFRLYYKGEVAATAYRPDYRK